MCIKFDKDNHYENGMLFCETLSAIKLLMES